MCLLEEVLCLKTGSFRESASRQKRKKWLGQMARTHKETGNLSKRGGDGSQ